MSMPVMSVVEQAFCRSAPWRAFARRAVLPWTLSGTPLTGDVLELGAGSGAMAEGVALSHPQIRLSATDIDPAMVRAARHRLSGLDGVTVKHADVTDLPFDDESFDAVTSYLMLHHVIDWPTALEEAARVLRPGGTFIGYDFTDTLFARLIHQADRSPHRILSADELRNGLETAGFEDVAVRTSYRDHVMRFKARKPTG
jgi:SAM-dependent methyltransferase